MGVSMAYSNSVGDAARLLRITVTSVTDFAGRSRRTEIAYYWAAITLVSVVLSLAIGTVVSFETSLLFSNALKLVVMVPMFALFVRRLHDQDMSGWWGLLLPASILLSVPRIMAKLHGDVAEIIAQRVTPTGIAASLCGLAVFILCVLPGTHGTNRYGHDPRLEEI